MNNSEKKIKLSIGQNDENFIGYRAQIEDVNWKIIKKLMKVSAFSFTFMLIEFIGGYIAGSLAIMTDAAHLLSDLSGFVISMFSLYIALHPANFQFTYGYHRAEVIGALSSILIIWTLTVWLIYEAVHRLYNPQKIEGFIMVLISVCGLIFNLIMSKILMNEELPNAFEDIGNNTRKDINDTLDEAETNNDLEKPLLQGNEKKNPVLQAAYIHILGI